MSGYVTKYGFFVLGSLAVLAACATADAPDGDAFPLAEVTALCGAPPAIPDARTAILTAIGGEYTDPRFASQEERIGTMVAKYTRLEDSRARNLESDGYVGSANVRGGVWFVSARLGCGPLPIDPDATEPPPLRAMIGTRYLSACDGRAFIFGTCG